MKMCVKHLTSIKNHKWMVFGVILLLLAVQINLPLNLFTQNFSNRNQSDTPVEVTRICDAYLILKTQTVEYTRLQFSMAMVLDQDHSTDQNQIYYAGGNGRYHVWVNGVKFEGDILIYADLDFSTITFGSLVIRFLSGPLQGQWVFAEFLEEWSDDHQDWRLVGVWTDLKDPSLTGRILNLNESSCFNLSTVSEE